MNGSVKDGVGWVALSLGLALATSMVGCSTPRYFAPEIYADDLVGLDCEARVFESSGPLDIAIAIDTSLSTGEPSGVDVDRDGIVGMIDESYNTDPDDSKLAAIGAGVQTLLNHSAGHDIRFSLITFSGRTEVYQDPPQRVISKREAQIRVDLTDNISWLSDAVDQTVVRGSKGTSNFFAGMRRSSRSLIERPDRERVSRRIVLFISDSPTPLNRRMGSHMVFSTSDGRLESSAREAIRHRIIFNTFGLSRESTGWRKQPLGLIAGATGGRYYAVVDPSQLYCHLAESLNVRSDFTAEEMEEFFIEETAEASEDDLPGDSLDDAAEESMQ